MPCLWPGCAKAALFARLLYATASIQQSPGLLARDMALKQLGQLAYAPCLSIEKRGAWQGGFRVAVVVCRLHWRQKSIQLFAIFHCQGIDS